MSSAEQPRRVVITGLGAITPLGPSVVEFWSAICAGKSAVGPITALDASAFTARIAAEVREFEPEKYLDRGEAKRLSRFLQFTVAASDDALKHSQLNLDRVDKERVGCMIGSGIGGLDILGEQHRRQLDGGPGRVSPFLVPYMIPDMASGYTSIRYGFQGPNSCVVTACSTGANAIGDAMHIIRRGEADVMIAGGAEAPITEIGLAGFCAARALSTRNDEPERASRPFDVDRDGFVMGEGAGVVILESLEHAQAREASIYGEIVGYAMTGDAFHITQPEPTGDGARRSMTLALTYSGLSPDDIGYINAHGTSTPYGDRLESLAIEKVFGEGTQVPVSSTKSMIGHTLGAAGAIESIVCIQALNSGLLPPTINLENQDPDCRLDYVPNKARAVDVEYVMKNSFGFGGHNVTLIFRKWNG
ncbi:MAG: beta-ketoacyl-ACP synthase II [Armatimonadota bacterium]|nr:beta-ketoacyl-ACP synthase II [Armatimonadota bacterium]